MAGIQEREKEFMLLLIAPKEGCSGAAAAKWRVLGAGKLIG